jgi:hypothetical protein
MKFELDTLNDYSDEEILSELRRVASALNGQHLTHDRFNQLSRVHSTTLRSRFGSWRAALDRAGISELIAPRWEILTLEEVLEELKRYAAESGEHSATKQQIAARLGVDPGSITRRFGAWPELLRQAGLSSVALGRRYSDDECFENVLSLWTHYGRQPRFAELNRPPSAVGSKAYIKRWGGWRAALAAFVERANRAEPDRDEPPPSQAAHEVSSDARSSFPRSVSVSLRYKVLQRDHFRCVLCGASPALKLGTILHIDHIIPWSRGGQNVFENLRTLCEACNLGKGSKLEEA